MLEPYEWLDRELLEQHGIRLNVVGRKDLLPPAVQAAVQQAEEMTRHHDRYVFRLDTVFKFCTLKPCIKGHFKSVYALCESR